MLNTSQCTILHLKGELLPTLIKYKTNSKKKKKKNNQRSAPFKVFQSKNKIFFRNYYSFDLFETLVKNK